MQSCLAEFQIKLFISVYDYLFQESRSSSVFRKEVGEASIESRPLTTHSDIVLENRTTLLRPVVVYLNQSDPNSTNGKPAGP